FERQKYWIDPKKPVRQEGQLGSPAKNPDISRWFYLPSWRQALPPVSVQSAAREESGSERPRTWLVFMDSLGLGRQIGERLRQEGFGIVTVSSGQSFRSSNWDYVIDPDDPGDYQRLVEELRTTGRYPYDILHLCSLTKDWPIADRMANCKQAAANGFYSLLFLAKAL